MSEKFHAFKKKEAVCAKGQDGRVEHAHRTHEEEFYQVYADDWEIPVMNKVLEEKERFYNQVRPHHSLDNLTPKEYIQSNYPLMASTVSFVLNLTK